MKTVVLVLSALAAAYGVRADDSESGIRDAEKAWAAAVVAHDYPALDQILAEKLIYAHATGAIESKRDYLGRLRSGAQKYASINHESTRVVSYGDSAVTHSVMRMKGWTNGKPFDDHVMMLHCWEKLGGVWRLAAHQTTKLPE